MALTGSTRNTNDPVSNDFTGNDFTVGKLSGKTGGIEWFTVINDIPSNGNDYQVGVGSSRSDGTGCRRNLLWITGIADRFTLPITLPELYDTMCSNR